ncbi:SulP family inorganic anion transporter [Lyngbya sp. PCC 8106]|uniref:bicarbonate transporter BicA n=1 Tax=Lyngbya sp. (strain PCC 8106) TaxID=313612 RepID=UPI0000EA96D5|nr:SulP family inorganic anion transporter [Lyngbya sp. PCC 8106]EAW35680.1 Sulfate transporter/antisigma-factor antagonist STAS [Lyngbya sp. PCC 8106]
MQITRITNQIHFRNLQGDIFGGVTAAVIALPMALAFGVASGAPNGAAVGLWGAVLVGFFAALFGGTPTLISEPTGPMTVVFTAVVARSLASAPDEQTGMAMAFTVVMLAGVFQLVFGTLKLGKYITLMPYTVISGFMSGIGMILIILQIGPMLGQASPKGGVLGTLQNIPNLISNINPIETVLGVLTIGIIFFMPQKLKKIVPPQLIALIAGTLISLMVFPNVDIRRIGEIPMGLPEIHLPVFSLGQINSMLIDALVLGMLGCIDSLLTSVIADSLTQTQHNSDKELIGQGIGNLISGICGGLPGAGATMGTVVNIQAGGRTAVSGLTRALILLVIVLAAAPLTQNIPMAVLAGIALKVGIDIIDWKFLKRAHRLSWKAAAIMYGVVLLTVFYDLIVAVGVGVFIANMLTIKRLADIQAEQVKAIDTPNDEVMSNEEAKQLMKQANGRILLLDLGGPMSFGAAKAITQRQTILDNYQALIIDLNHVPLLGVTATLALEKMIDSAYNKSIDIYIVGGEDKVKTRLQRFNILDRLPQQNRVATRVAALRRALASINGEVIENNEVIEPESHDEGINGYQVGPSDAATLQKS